MHACRLGVALTLLVLAGSCARPSQPPPGEAASPITSAVEEQPASATTGAGEQAAAAPQDTTSIVAEATVQEVAVFAAPDSPSPGRKLAHPQASGAPLVFLVREQRAGWLKVLLPVRPNGSTGWIREDDVALTEHDFRIVVELGRHLITVYNGHEVFLQEPVGIGKQNTPTPGGLHYTKELLQPPDPHTVYGPYAYGLSGFSNVLESFAGGEGVIGVHGNDDPSTLGKDVSSGCIRMSNDGITKLAHTLPLGVPVEIRP